MIRVNVDLIKEKFPYRDSSYNKNDMGKVLIIAGSDRYPTAGVIVSKSAMRAGCGLVTLATSKYARKFASSQLLEEMTIEYEDDFLLDEIIEKSDSIAIGSGLGRTEDKAKLLEKLIETDKKIIVDADAIFHLKKLLLNYDYENIVITPHEGEFSKLIDVSVEKLHENREKYAREFASMYNIKVLLKGKNTLITDGNMTYYIDKGSYKMATGGMGDLLTGIIASFAASGMNLFDAAISGAYIHSYIADILAKDMYTVLASDIIERLPFVINDILSIK